MNSHFFVLSKLLEDTNLSASDIQVLSAAARQRKLSWLRILNLSRNTLTDAMHVLNLSMNFLTESLVLIVDNKMSHLETLLLEDTGTRDILPSSSAVRRGKLPVLKHLNISQQNLCDLELPVTNLVRRCATDIQKKMQVNISLTSYGREFQQDVRFICNESKVNVS